MIVRCRETPSWSWRLKKSRWWRRSSRPHVDFILPLNGIAEILGRLAKGEAIEELRW